MKALIDRVLAPALEDPPCGPDLEYDAAALELDRTVQMLARASAPAAVGSTATLDWSWVERRALSLLERSKDLRYAVHATRAWIRLRGVEGLSDGLALVMGLLQRYWPCAHPALDADDDDDPTARLSVLGTLTHHDGLLADLRDATLAWNGLEPVKWRELEAELLSTLTGQPVSGPTARIVAAEIARTPSVGAASEAALDLCHDLRRLLVRHVGPARALDLSPLSRLVECLYATTTGTASSGPDSASP